MGRSLCPDRPRLTVALASAVCLLIAPGAAAQIAVIAGGGLVGWWLYRQSGGGEKPLAFRGKGHGLAALAFVLFLALLLLLPALAAATGQQPLAVFDSFYRAGSLVFGGGHVVLPLLRAEVVPHGWVGDDAFLAGYGAAQALPGPLFTFAAYLGTVMRPGGGAWLAGLWCLLAIFLPPHGCSSAARCPSGINSAPERGRRRLCGAPTPPWSECCSPALYRPVWTEGVSGAGDVAAVVVAFGLLQWWKAPPWLVVLLAAAAGEWLLG